MPPASPNPTQPQATAGDGGERSGFLAGYRALLRRVRQEYVDPAIHLEMARFFIHHNRLDRALSSLCVARALQPRRTETLYLLGWLHQRESNPSEARRVYRQILQNNPEECQAQYHLACLLEEEGDDSAAVKAFKRVLALDPSHAEAYWHLGLLSRRLGDCPKAINYLAALRALQPGNHTVSFEMARCYQALGIADKAILHLQAAIQAAPDHLPSKLLLAEVYLQGKAFPQAEHLLNEVLSTAPRSPEVYLLLSRLHTANDKKHQAMAALLQFQKVFPLDHRGSFEIGKLYAEQGEHELAEAELERALDMAPENIEIYGVLGRVYEQTGNREKAIRHALLVCERFPESAASYEQLAWVYERHHLWAEARDAVTKALGLSPRDDRLYCRRARLHVEAGDYNQAVADFQQARELNPDSAEAKLDTDLIRGHKAGRKAFDLYVQGREAADRGDFPQALGLYRQVIGLVPDNVNWLRDMLEVFVSMGQFRDAAKLLESLLALTPQDAALCRRAALIHYSLGDYDQAFRLFEQAVGKEPADVTSRVHVLRALAHRVLERSVSPDRGPVLLAAYRENLGRAKDTDLARLELGHFFLAVGRHVMAGPEWRRGARENLSAVSDRASRDVLVWRWRGLLELALVEGNEAERIPMARRLCELSPDDPTALVACLEAVLDGPLPSDDERDRLFRMLEGHPANGFLRALRMKLIRKSAMASADARSQLKREIRNCQRSVSEEPEGALGLLDLGLALRYLAPPGEWVECSHKAEIAFTKAAGLDPGSPWPWWAMAKNCAGSPDGEHRADRSRLRAITGKALRRFPSEPLIHYHVGESAIESADPAEQETGLRELTIATVLSSEMAPAHLALARHYRRLGQSPAAHHHYLRVLECSTGGRLAQEARAEMSRLV